MDKFFSIKNRMVFPEHSSIKNSFKTISRPCIYDNCVTTPKTFDTHQVEYRSTIDNLCEEDSSTKSNEMGKTINEVNIEKVNFDTLRDDKSGGSGSIIKDGGDKTFSQRFRGLVNSINQRFIFFRRNVSNVPSPLSDQSDTETYQIQSTSLQTTTTNKDEKVTTEQTNSTNVESAVTKCDSALDPQGKVFLTWLMLVTLSYMYNSWVIPLRSTFPYQTDGNVSTWMMFDYIADFIYFIDLIFIKPRVMYLSDGFWIRDGKLTRTTYFHKSQFKMDVLSLLPTDLLCLKYGYKYLPLYRLPRLLKIQTFWEFYNRCDSLVSSAYVVRVARTLTYMLYLVHLNACAYYAFSSWEGLGTNGWVFNGRGNAYIRCFYFATKTATSIGKNPKPENEVEYMFMTCSWLMGVFVFALLIGQIRDIIATATRSRTEYRKLVDETLEYMRRLNLPMDLQERVKLWFKFTWEQQHTFNEANLLDTLPHKMKTDVAINVHIQSLSKVQLFHDCDPALLRELVLKLTPVLFLPGDYICRKGEVGKEMYIVQTGLVQVMGDSDEEVLATLREGSVFGEISLLSLTGGNRRTATVKSGGFSNLFILSKSDLNEALVHYPDAQAILKKKAQQLMRENAERERLNRLKEQSEEDFTEDDSDDDTASVEDFIDRSPKLVSMSEEQEQAHLLSLAALPVAPPIPDKYCYKCRRRIEPPRASDKSDTIECHVTVHQEMN